MFKRILLPLDLTNKHTAAVARAADMIAQGGGEVILLHVIEVIPGLDMDEEKDFYARLEAGARAHLDKVGATLTARRIPWHAKIVFGNRALETARFAAEHASDLIILTTPAVDPSKPGLGWGSLSYKVSMLAACPVLLVK